MPRGHALVGLVEPHGNINYFEVKQSSPGKAMNVLISGAGVAGPTLAYWLAAHGHQATMVEKAPALRTGGYVIDFWGAGIRHRRSDGTTGRHRALRIPRP